MKKLIHNQSGFSLLEVLVVAGILATAIIGMLNLFIFTSTGAELARNKTIVVSEVQGKLAEIREYTFDDITTDYGSGGTMGNTFSLSAVNGMGSIFIDDTNPQLLTVGISVSWEDKYGRIVGEDQDLDGTLDPGEDLDGDGALSSPVEFMTQIGDR